MENSWKGLDVTDTIEIKYDPRLNGKLWMLNTGNLRIAPAKPSWWDRVKCWFGFHRIGWWDGGCIYCDRREDGE